MTDEMNEHQILMNEIARIKALDYDDLRKEQEKEWGRYFNLHMKFVSDFYWGKHNLPNNMHTSLRRWATANSILVNRIAGKKGVELHLTLFNTAFTEGEGIYVPFFIFLPIFYSLSKIHVEESQIMAAIIYYNGFIIHEAAHIRYTFVYSKMLGKKFDYFEAMEKIVPEEERMSKLLKSIWNFTEDIYIDAEGVFDFPYIYRFTELLSDLFYFKQEELKPAIEAFNANPSLDTAIGVIQYLRNPNCWYDKDWPEIFSEVRDIMIRPYNEGIYDPTERLAIAHEAYKLLKEKLQEHYDNTGATQQNAETGETEGKKVSSEEEFYTEEKQEQKEGTGEGQGQGDGEGDPAQQAYDSMTEEEKELVRSEAKQMEEEMKTSLSQDSMNHAQKNAHVDQAIDTGLHYPPKQTVVRRASGMSVIDIMQLQDVRHDKVPYDESFKNFNTMLKHARIRKPKRKRSDETGDLDDEKYHEIRMKNPRLFAIQNQLKRVRGEPEIVWLIDASGSTNSVARRGADGSVKRIFDLELEAVYACSKDMLDARMYHSVYAHTSGDGCETIETPSEYGCHIYGIYSYGMPFMGSQQNVNHEGLHEERFRRGYNIDKGGNYDGLALEYAGEQFSNRPGAKLIILASDGAPSDAPSGYSPTEYAKEAVKNLRAKGIMVISLSVTENVVRNNNDIYGENYNIDASTDIFGEVQKLISAIAEATTL